MIEKVQSLESIGKFRSYLASGVVTFQNLTLIYAENGSGKTTLSRIFKSLTDNDPELIRRRESTLTTAAQAAQIYSKDSSSVRTTHTFNASGWNHPLPNVEIFDIHFVNENVYSGFEFSDDHKKKLHQFVIGSQGIAIQQQIEQNKTAKTAKRLLIDGIEQQIITGVGNGMTRDMLPSILMLTTTLPATIAQDIANSRSALQSANANTAIRSLPLLQQYPNITTTIDFDRLIAILENTTHQIQDAAMKLLFDNHCVELSNNSLQHPDNWLHTGFNYIATVSGSGSDVLCPFCKQELIPGMDILNAYSQRFNEAFNSHVTEIENALTELKNVNIDSFLQVLTERTGINTTNSATWHSYIPNVTAPNINLVSNEAALRLSLQNSIADFTQKQRNPSGAIATTNLIELREFIAQIRLQIGNSNQEINNYNTEINRFKAGIQTVATAENNLNDLLRRQQRATVTIDTLCTTLRQEKTLLRGLDTTYTGLVQTQEAAVSAFFTTYGTRINHYLQTVFKTPFQIANVANIAPQGQARQPKLGFNLTIDGAQISDDVTQNRNLKDCLSEGDKSTIAFAFFLSKLDLDTAIADKIIVFDDPLSSFDRNRKMNTVGLLRELRQRAKQLIVLSHNEHFLHELWSTKIAAGLKVSLWISPNFVSNSSELKPLDLDKLIENDYFRHLKELQDFLATPDILKKEHVLGLIRNVLESHIKFKFFRQLLPQGSGGTFGALIVKCKAVTITFRDSNTASVYSALELLNDVSWRPHHGGVQPTYPVGGIDPSTMTITELQGCITDAFNLIENRL